MVGEKEKMTKSVNVRTRDNKVHGELSVAEVLDRLTLLKQSRCQNAEEEFWSRQRTNRTFEYLSLLLELQSDEQERDKLHVT